MARNIEAEVIDPAGGAVAVAGDSSLAAITRGEIDVQIATAHQFPRSLAKFKARAIEMATMDEDTAASCLYRRPVGKKNGKEEYAEGMSVRMAEIVAAGYGNIRVGSMIIEMTDRLVKARGYAHDLESNFAATSEVVESTVTKEGRPFSERMRIVVAKATLAKARRDATFMVVPKAVARPIEQAVRNLLVGDGTAATIEKRRANVAQWIDRLGIDRARVFAALGVAGMEDVGIAEMETLAGLKTAIKDGDITIDEAFPELKQNTPHEQQVASKLELDAALKKCGAAPAEALQVAQLMIGENVTALEQLTREQLRAVCAEIDRNFREQEARHNATADTDADDLKL